jgi:hypothetical protein
MVASCTVIKASVCENGILETVKAVIVSDRLYTEVRMLKGKPKVRMTLKH